MLTHCDHLVGRSRSASTLRSPKPPTSVPPPLPANPPPSPQQFKPLETSVKFSTLIEALFKLQDPQREVPPNVRVPALRDLVELFAVALYSQTVDQRITERMQAVREEAEVRAAEKVRDLRKTMRLLETNLDIPEQ